MANGNFQGGFAQGVETGRAGDRASRGLDIQELSAAEAVRQKQEGLGLEERGLDIKEQQFQDVEQRERVTLAREGINDLMKVIKETGTQLLDNGESPSTIAKTLQPFLDEIAAVGKRVDIDVTPFFDQADALLGGQNDELRESVREKVQMQAFERDERVRQGLDPEPEPEPEDENNLFGIDVPPVVRNFNVLSKPTQTELFKANKEVRDTTQLLTELEIFKRLNENAQTGRLTEVTLPMIQFFEQAGITLNKDIALLEAIQQAGNQLALRLRNPASGFGLTGNTSDRDLTFLKNAVGGLQNTPEGNRAGIMLQIAKMRRVSDIASLRAELLARNSPQSFTKLRKAYIEATPLFLTEEEAILNGLKTGGKDFTVMDGVEIRAE